MSKLTFDDDLQTILDLSESISAAFVHITHRRDLKEDARGDAILALVNLEFNANNGGWRSYLKTRALGLLIRDYQNKTGQRLKRKPRFTEYLEAAPNSDDTKNDDCYSDDVDSCKTAINNALRHFPKRSRDVLTAWIAGKKQTEIAQELGVTRGRVSQIVSSFKTSACIYRETGAAVAVVDPRTFSDDKTRERYPLFFANDENKTGCNDIGDKLKTERRRHETH